MGEEEGRDSVCNSQMGSWVSRAHQYVRSHTLVSQECIRHVSALDLDTPSARHRYPVLGHYQASILG